MQCWSGVFFRKRHSPWAHGKKILPVTCDALFLLPELANYARLLLALMPRGSYCFVASFSFVLLLAVLGSFLYAPRDPKQCAMSYSRPEFIKQLALDTSWSRLAGKYSLYLYREGGIDMSKQVNTKGQPVLFIPGHAGSYKQSRSIASETTVQFDQLLKRSGRQGQQAKLDFFTCKYIRNLLDHPDEC